MNYRYRIDGVDIGPQDIDLDWPVPFVGTFRKTEAEIAAGFLVLAMSEKGNEWCAVTPPEVGAALKKAVTTKEHASHSWATNPFVRPNFDLLLEYGFAEFTDPTLGRGSPMRFTVTGLEAMAASKWVRIATELKRNGGADG